MLRLTEAGQAKIHSVSPHTNSLRQRLWSVLNEAQRLQLQDLLQRLQRQQRQLDEITGGNDAAPTQEKP